jgi:hypothetical protein
MAIKQGVIVTSGWPERDIRRMEEGVLTQYRSCLPQEPSAVFTGISDRHEVMHRILFPVVRPRKFACLGSDRPRPMVTDQAEQRAIEDLVLNAMRDDFVILADREVVAVLFPDVVPKSLTVYLATFEDMDRFIKVLGVDGAVKEQYPSDRKEQV